MMEHKVMGEKVGEFLCPYALFLQKICKTYFVCLNVIPNTVH